MDIAKKRGGGGGEGFQDMFLGEIQELCDTTREELTKDDLMNISATELVPDNEEEAIEKEFQKTN